MPATAGAAQSVTSGPQPITAQVEQSAGELAGDIVHVDGETIHATPGYFYVRGQATTRAYTLDPDHPLRTPLITWHAVSLGTRGLHGIATALWLLFGHLPGKPLPGDLEAAARQIAIWAKGDALSINHSTVPNRRLRERALVLARAAPNNYNASNLQQPNTLLLSAFVQHTSADISDVVVNVGDDMEDTFNQPQAIDVRIANRFPKLRTGSRFDVVLDRNGSALPIRRSGSATDDNTMVLRLFHLTGVTQLQLFWGVTLSAGIAMFPNGDAPAIITADPIELRLPATLYPGAASSQSGSTASWLLGIAAGWVSALLAALALWQTQRRKPTLRGAWNVYDHGAALGEVTAVAGRRPIELREIGLEFSWGAPWRRRHHRLAGMTRREIPTLLQDGASIGSSFEREDTLEKVKAAIGERATEVAVARPYVRASGKDFHGRALAASPWARVGQFLRSLRVPPAPSVPPPTNRTE